MLQVVLRKNEPLKLLFLGAHSDDIEIGCGGTAIRILKEYPDCEVDWVVFSSNRERAEEARCSAALFLKNSGRRNILIKEFRDGFFPYIGAEIKSCFEELKKIVSPDLIFTHNRNDLHQDHRLISELTWNTFRNHLILEYEIVKYDGDIGAPNVFFNLDKNQAEQKIKFLMEAFKSQGKREWFTEDAFTSIMRIRGIESNAAEKFAEAFYCRKIVF
jgi:LmbE family N-acetylglucosaminyl deacetylase